VAGLARNTDRDVVNTGRPANSNLCLVHGDAALRRHLLGESPGQRQRREQQASMARRASSGAFRMVGIAPLPKILARGTDVGRSRSWRSRWTPSTSGVVATTRSTIYAVLGERAGTVAPRQHRQPTADRSDHHDF
jgi:hypothetical protein